jgi:hypothetical protein
MVVSRVISGRFRERNESAIFYTPSPDESPVNLTGPLDDDNEDAVSTGFPGGAVHLRGRTSPEGSPRAVQSFGFPTSDSISLICSDFTFSNFELKKSVSEQMKHSQQDRSSIMGFTTSSLTSFHDESSANKSNRFSHTKLGNSHPAASHSPKVAESLISTRKPTSTQSFQSLGQLAGYATSDENESKEILIPRAKKRQPRKPIALRSVEIVASDSSESDTGRHPLSQSHSPHTSVGKHKKLQASTPVRHHNRAAGIVTRNKTDSKTGNMKNMTTKRRPHSPLASSSTTKRPNTKGGFVVTSSDESDTEGSDESDQDDCKHVDQSRSPAPQPSRVIARPSPFPASSKARPTPTPLPTKQLNKSRLNTLLGRIKSTTTTSKEKRMSVQTQQSIATARASTVTPRPAAPLHIQCSTPVRSAGSSDVGRGKRSTTASTTRDVKGLGQQPKSMDSSVFKTEDKTTSIFRETEQPSGDENTQGGLRKQISSTSVPRSTATMGSPSISVLQQREPTTSTSTLRNHKNGESSQKITHATKPRSLLQMALDEAKSDSIDQPSTKARSGDQDKLGMYKRGAVSTPSVIKSERTLLPSTKERDTVVGVEVSKKHTLSPKATRLEPAQRVQERSSMPGLEDRKFTLNESRANTAIPKSVPSVLGQPGQKRKLDSISGGSGSIHGTTTKKPALSATLPKRSGDTQTAPKVDITTCSNAASGAFPRKVPTKTSELSPTVRSSATGKNSGSAIATKPVDKSTIPVATLLPEADLFSRPDGFLRVSAKSVADKSLKSTQHGSAAPDVTNPAQHESLSLGPVAAPSLKPSIPSKTPSAINSHSSLMEGLPQKDALNVSASMRRPKKASNAAMTDTCTVDMALDSPTDSIEKEMPRLDQPLEARTLVNVDSVNHATEYVQRHDATFDLSSIPKTDDGLADQSEVIVQRGNSFLLMDVDSPPVETVKIASETAVTALRSQHDTEMVSPQVTVHAEEEALHLRDLPEISKEAQPYFEYSVFQKTWQSEQADNDVPPTEITVRPFTNIDEANAQAEKLFRSSPTLFSDVIFESSHTRDEHGCFILTGSITPFDNPARKSHVKIWVQRDLVSKLANQTPQALKGTSFISSTCYILRLFKLTTPLDTEDSSSCSSSSSSSSSTSTNSTDLPIQEPLRTYQAHTRPEIYTTLSAANRAARALQIQLSHEKEPKTAMSKAFQQKNLEELDAKVVQLLSSTDAGGGCWSSRFNACGLGGDSLELVVEKTAVCGPRNL